MQIRVVLADDHTLVRTGMRALLEQLDGVTVVGEASNGREALELVSRLRPHLVLMDISMPELNGLEAADHVRREHPEVRIILLSMYADEAYVTRALAVGASGYVLKSAGAVELELAVRAVARGESYLSPAVARQVMQGPAGEGGPDAASLSTRQREVLQLLAEGNSTKQIAGKLSLSIKTIETHRANIMERLGIHDVPGLVRYAIRNGLVDPGRR